MVECSNCHRTGFVWTETMGQSNRGNPWRLYDPQIEQLHECLPGHTNEKDVHIKNTKRRGFPCYQCGRYILKDDSLPEIIRLNPTSNRPMKPEPKLREVVRRLDSQGRTIDDLDSGVHHTRYRCMLLKDGYPEKVVEQMEYDFWTKHEWILAGLRSKFTPI